MLTATEDYYGSDTLQVGDDVGLAISSLVRTSIPSNSRLLNLSCVLHVPDMSTSLLSIHHFTSDNNVFFEFHPSFLL